MKGFFAWLARQAARSWFLGQFVMKLSALAAWTLPDASWKKGNLLQLAAKKSGFGSYAELVYSRAPGTHSATLEGEFIGSGYFGFSFHFAFVTGLFFPDFLRKAIENPALFYAQEVTLSALVALGLTTFMITGHMGTLAYTAYRTNNLSEHIEKEWEARLRGGRFRALLFALSFVLIPFGRFPGVIRERMSFKLDGESPLEVSASGPKLWDRTVSLIAWACSVPLIVVAVLHSTGSLQHLPAVFEWLTRIAVPLAFVATLGTYLTGRGAHKTFVAEKHFSRKKTADAERQYDLVALKEALSRGDQA